jgi:hypothetical protein
MSPLITGGRSDAVPVGRLNVIAVLILLGSIALGLVGTVVAGNPIPVIVMTVIGVILMQAARVAKQWERAVVLRLGRYVGLRGPGLFWIVPFVDGESLRSVRR